MAREPGSEHDRSSTWRRCPPGEFDRLGQRLRKRRQRRQFLRGLSTAAAVVVAGGSGAWLWVHLQPAREAEFGGITCSEVQRLVKPYSAGELDPAVRKKIRLHLTRCPRCGPAFEAMRS